MLGTEEEVDEELFELVCAGMQPPSEAEVEGASTIDARPLEPLPRDPREPREPREPRPLEPLDPLDPLDPPSSFGTTGSAPGDASETAFFLLLPTQGAEAHGEERGANGPLIFLRKTAISATCIFLFKLTRLCESSVAFVLYISTVALMHTGIDSYDALPNMKEDKISNQVRNQISMYAIVNDLKSMILNRGMESANTRIPAASPTKHCHFEKHDMIAFSKSAKLDPVAIQVRKKFSRKMASVYADMCGLSLWMSRNVFESGSCEFTMHPSIDSMGVVFTANTIMRVMYPGESAEFAHDPEEFMQLTLTCRIYMAAAFFLSYKLKSEDGWKSGTGMSAYLLSKFLAPYELRGVGRSKMSDIIMDAELAILDGFKIHTISEFNFYSVAEYKLEYLLKEGVITPLAASMALSVVSFYLHLFTGVVDTELLEEMAENHGGDAVCLALVAIALSSIMSSFTVDTNNLPRADRIIFNSLSLNLALKMVTIRVNCKEFASHGFPSLCCLPVAKKAHTLITETIQHWTPSSQENENLENGNVKVDASVEVS